jgi:hypothetical protein
MIFKKVSDANHNNLSLDSWVLKWVDCELNVWGLILARDVNFFIRYDISIDSGALMADCFEGFMNSFPGEQSCQIFGCLHD